MFGRIILRLLGVFLLTLPIVATLHYTRYWINDLPLPDRMREATPRQLGFAGVTLLAAILLMFTSLPERALRAEGLRSRPGRALRRAILFVIMSVLLLLTGLGLMASRLVDHDLKVPLVAGVWVLFALSILWWLLPGYAYSDQRPDSLAREPDRTSDPAATVDIPPEPIRRRRSGALLLAWACLLPALFVMMYGWSYAVFMPDRTTYEWAEAARLAMIALVALAVMTVVLYVARPVRLLGRTPAVAGIAFVILGGAVWDLGPEGLSRGVGFVHASVTEGEPAHVDVTVIQTGSRSHGRRSRMCDFGARVRPDGWTEDDIGVCGLPPDLHQDLEEGDRFRLAGTGTALGVRYTRAVALPRGADAGG